MRVWSTERRVALILLHGAGTPVSRMSAFFGKSRHSVIHQLRLVGLRISCECACGNKRGSREDGKCSWCRNGQILEAKRPQPYPWKPEWDLLIRRQLGNIRDKWAYSRALRYIVGVTRVPLHTVKDHVYQLGLGVRRGPKAKAWTEQEEAFLQEWVGTKTAKTIAHELGRSVCAVYQRISEIKLSAIITAGYSQVDLVGLLGVSAGTVRLWESYGWLSRCEGRFPEVVVERFLRLHPEEYDLRLVDQAWFKGMLFPATFGMTRRAPKGVKLCWNQDSSAI